jgi:hypothetical protein
MLERALALALLSAAAGANATCVTDAPEIGDTGPSSELVCRELERRFPGAALAVEGRAIHSPTEVTAIASADGVPVLVRYELHGHAWRADEVDARTAGVPGPRSGLAVRR